MSAPATTRASRAYERIERLLAEQRPVILDGQEVMVAYLLEVRARA